MNPAHEFKIDYRVNEMWNPDVGDYMPDGTITLTINNPQDGLYGHDPSIGTLMCFTVSEDQMASIAGRILAEQRRD